MEQVPCPECEQQVGVTKAGLLYKHSSGDGPCPGSGKVMQQDDGADWLDDEPQLVVGESVPGLVLPDAGARARAGLTVAVEVPAEVPKGAVIRDLLPGGPRDTYRWLARVSLPALYLDDAGWHQQNELMAVKQAEDAGCAVTGEARWDRQPDYRTDGGLVLTYLVPIKS